MRINLEKQRLFLDSRHGHLILWLLIVMLIVANLDLSTSALQPRLTGVVISPDIPPYSDATWENESAAGHVDSLSAESGQTVISGWIGPSTDGLWVLAESSALLNVETFNRPDVNEALDWPDGYGLGFSLSIDEQNVMCIWYIIEESRALRYAENGASCER